MQKKFKSRRKLNKAAATVIGLGALNHWVTPLIDVIVTPAHAQTSSNVAPILSIENPSPEIFNIIISDDNNNFSYSIDIFTIEDTAGNRFDPPIFRETVTGNSGVNASVAVERIVSSQSAEEFRVTAIDSDGEQSEATFTAVTP